MTCGKKSTKKSGNELKKIVTEGLQGADQAIKKLGQDTDRKIANLESVSTKITADVARLDRGINVSYIPPLPPDPSLNSQFVPPSVPPACNGGNGRRMALFWTLFLVPGQAQPGDVGWFCLPMFTPPMAVPQAQGPVTRINAIGTQRVKNALDMQFFWVTRLSAKNVISGKTHLFSKTQ